MAREPGRSHSAEPQTRPAPLAECGAGGSIPPGAASPLGHQPQESTTAKGKGPSVPHAPEGHARPKPHPWADATQQRAHPGPLCTSKCQRTTLPRTLRAGPSWGQLGKTVESTSRSPSVPWACGHRAACGPRLASDALHAWHRDSVHDRRPPPQLWEPRTWGACGPLRSLGLARPGRGPHSHRSSRSHRGPAPGARRSWRRRRRRPRSTRPGRCRPCSWRAVGGTCSAQGPPSAWPRSPGPGPTKPTSFSPSRNGSEVEWAAPAEGGVGGTLSRRHVLASRQARPAGRM